VIDLDQLEEDRDAACIDKVDLFDFYNKNWGRLVAEIKLLRKATTRVVELDADNCPHNFEIDPDSGQCRSCGTYLP
jgi:hypothetical protein